MRHTRVIWSDAVRAPIRVEVPGTPGYDRHFWTFVTPADEVRFRRRMARSQAEIAAAAKVEARRSLDRARVARVAGCRRHVVEALDEAAGLIRSARTVGGQARLNAARATFTKSWAAT